MHKHTRIASTPACMRGERERVCLFVCMCSLHAGLTSRFVNGNLRAKPVFQLLFSHVSHSPEPFGRLLAALPLQRALPILRHSECNFVFMAAPSMVQPWQLAAGKPSCAANSVVVTPDILGRLPTEATAAHNIIFFIFFSTIAIGRMCKTSRSRKIRWRMPCGVLVCLMRRGKGNRGILHAQTQHTELSHATPT